MSSHQLHNRKSICRSIQILLLAVLLLPVHPAAAAEEPNSLYALSACLMDADSGRVLFEKAGYEKMAMASTTKIMTLLIALEYGTMEEIVSVSAYAASMPDVQLTIREGEQYYLKDLLFSLMLESHNDVAVAIAEHIGGSVEGFAAMMNGKAKALGAEHTHFVTPNGLDAEEHYTTAVDLARIASYAIQNETFLAITNTPEHTFSEVTGKRQFAVYNKNAFLTMMEGAIGVKTGFTGKAGYCFVGAVNRDGKKLVSVVLGCGWPNHKTYKWSDTKKLMHYGLQNFEKKTCQRGDILLPQIPVAGGTYCTTTVECQFDALTMLLSETEEFTWSYELPEQLFAPVAFGERIGTLRIFVGEETVGVYDLTAVEQIKSTDFPFYFQKVWQTFLQLGSLLRLSMTVF